MLKILKILMFFSLSICYAQDLHVENNAFIFIDGAGFNSGTDRAPLFVTNGINLRDVNSTIYLRNEAQIIQGSEINFNSGLGALSIYQEGTVNKFAYNYWCSPVGASAAGISNESFSPNLMRESTGLTTSQAFNFNPASVYDGDDTTNPVEIASRWFYTFIESDEYAEWIPLVTANPGIGFTMKGTSSLTGAFDPDLHGQQIDFRGKPNTGTINVPVNPPAGPDPQFTLTGNPYPSALDAHALIWDNDNINGTIANTADDITTGVLYFWDQDVASNSHFINDYVGGYASYTISEDESLESAVAAIWYDYDSAGNIDIGPLPNPNSKTPERYIAVGQGFMIEGNVDGFFRIKNSHRVFRKEAVPADGSLFYEASDQSTDIGIPSSSQDTESGLTEHGYKIIPDDYKRFRLFIEFNQTYTRELLHNFHASATGGYDYGLEAKSLEIIASDAHFLQDGSPMVIQANAFDENMRIPLKIQIADQQLVNFRLGDIQHFSESQPIFLHDKENEIYINLREINFEMILDSGQYDDRFEIVFQNYDTLSNPEEELGSLLLVQNNSAATLTLYNPNRYELDQLQIYDTAGKLILNHQNRSDETLQKFATNGLSDGLYLVSLSFTDRGNTNKKIIVKNY